MSDNRAFNLFSDLNMVFKLEFDAFNNDRTAH